ncbi:MAG: GxxExxY protein [Bacteroidales bacterium]|nr:GxxExxY protein [Bacteroidales bacterium]
MKITKQYLKKLNYQIVAAAIEVHKELGPGLLESIYEECLYQELLMRGLNSKRQVKVPVIYKGKQVKDDLRIDILVNDIFIVEVKSVLEMHPIFQAQLMTYLKLAEKPKGLLINFNVEKLIDGVTPIVNKLFAKLPNY